MSKPTVLHIGKLIFRMVMLLAAAAAFAYRGVNPSFDPAPLLALVWAAFMAEMVRRLFPIRSESIGCQKQYAYAFRPCGTAAKPSLPHRRALAVALLWAAVNLLFGLPISGAFSARTAWFCLAFSLRYAIWFVCWPSALFKNW